MFDNLNGELYRIASKKVDRAEPSHRRDLLPSPGPELAYYFGYIRDKKFSLDHPQSPSFTDPLCKPVAKLFGSLQFTQTLLYPLHYIPPH